MGVSTSCIVTIYSKEKEKIKKIDFENRADNFIYNIINDGGATFNPNAINNFTDDEREIMKVYFDENSGSVLQGYATVTPNIQDPNKMKEIWIKIRSGIIIEFNNSMKEYHEKLSSDSSAKMSEYKFNKKLFNYTWSLDCVSGIISLLQMAIINEYLIEITVADF